MKGRRLDGEQASPLFTELRLEIMGVLCPRRWELLFEALVPCMRGDNTGTPEVSFIPVAGSNEKELLARNMSRATAAWLDKFWSSNYKEGTVDSLMDSFEMDDRLLANVATFDLSTMMVESEFAA